MNARYERQVWKYKLEVTDTQGIEVPYGAEYLSCACQDRDIVLWFLVDPYTKLSERRLIIIAGTGHPISKEVLRTAKFIGSVLMFGGSLVWHIWMSSQGQ